MDRNGGLVIIGTLADISWVVVFVQCRVLVGPRGQKLASYSAELMVSLLLDCIPR